MNVPILLKEIVDGEVYKEDYENLTVRLLEEKVSYSTAIEALKEFVGNHMFE